MFGCIVKRWHCYVRYKGDNKRLSVNLQKMLVDFTDEIWKNWVNHEKFVWAYHQKVCWSKQRQRRMWNGRILGNVMVYAVPQKTCASSNSLQGLV